MKVLLLGASSYVGARLYYDLSKKFEVAGTYYDNKLSEKFAYLDITDAPAIDELIGGYKPDVIIHAAANSRSKWCEENPEQAIALNQESAKKIVSSANGAGSKVIFISSFAAINPTDVYGKTKRQSEEYVKDTKSGFVILRPSLIIGFSPNFTNDRSFNRILKNLDQGTNAAYDTSWKFQPSYLGHISEVISIIIDRKIVNETIPVAVKEVKTRYDIAKDILGAFNIKVTPVDMHSTAPTTIDNLEKLKSLNLPRYSYEDIISKTIDEIKHRKQYLKI